MDVSLTSPRILLAALCALALIVVVATTEAGPFLPVALLALGYVVWSFPRPTVAVVTIILLHGYVFEQSKDITWVELAVGAYLYGYLGFWFFTKVFITRERIVAYTSDFFLLSFLVLCLLSVVLIVAARGSIEYWFRECLTISTLLLSFPAREAMRTRKGRAAVFGAFGLLVGTLAFVNLVQYRASSLAANYFWELASGRKPFGSAFYCALTIWAVSLHLHVEGARNRLMTLVLALIGALALATTFFRGFWIAALIGGLVLLVLVERRGKMRLVWMSVSGALLAALVLFAAAGDLGGLIVSSAWDRLVSSGSALADISVANRIAETQSVLALVKDSPLVGYGIGIWFKHFNIITRETQTLMYVHNAYIYLLLKVGAIGLCLFGGYFGLTLREGIRSSRLVKEDRVFVAMLRGTIAIFVGFIFVAASAGILQDKQILLVIALGTAVATSRREG